MVFFDFLLCTVGGSWLTVYTWNLVEERHVGRHVVASLLQKLQKQPCALRETTHPGTAACFSFVLRRKALRSNEETRGRGPGDRGDLFSPFFCFIADCTSARAGRRPNLPAAIFQIYEWVDHFAPRSNRYQLVSILSISPSFQS